MKKFLALFLTALLLLAPMTIFAVGATSNKDINEEKITDELKEVMSDKMFIIKSVNLITMSMI